MSGSPGALCPFCGQPASYSAVKLGAWEMPLVGCACARDRVWALLLPVVLMTDNHDPGDEDRS